MCHAETVSKAGVVLLEKSRLYLDLFNSDVSNVDILVTLWHYDRSDGLNTMMQSPPIFPWSQRLLGAGNRTGNGW